MENPFSVLILNFTFLWIRFVCLFGCFRPTTYNFSMHNAFSTENSSLQTFDKGIASCSELKKSHIADRLLSFLKKIDPYSYAAT